MNLFGPNEAAHYCTSFGASQGPSAQSLRNYVATELTGVTQLSEGTPGFMAYRDCALRDAERFLFLTISLYRRFADLMVASAAGWAHVSLYYGSYYAAQSLLHIFGGHVAGKRTTIDVQTSTAGQQVLRITRNVKTANQGPHRAFWEIFYDSVQSLYPWVDPGMVFALQPVSGDVTWLIETRNNVNYDSFAAKELTTQFHSGFRRSRFPRGLPGVLNTQYQVFEGLMCVLCEFVNQVGLVTDALDPLPNGPMRKTRVRALIFDVAVPDLQRKIRRRRVLV